MTAPCCPTWLTLRSRVCFFPFSTSGSREETLVYTYVLIMLCCLVMLSFWWGWKESRGDNGKEVLRGGAGRFLQLLWMRYCLVVEHSWETSGHVDSCELVRTNTKTQKQMKLLQFLKRSLCIFFVPFSHFSTLLFPFLCGCVFPQQAPPFFFQF